MKEKFLLLCISILYINSNIFCQNNNKITKTISVDDIFEKADTLKNMFPYSAKPPLIHIFYIKKDTSLLNGKYKIEYPDHTYSIGHYYMGKKYKIFITANKDSTSYSEWYHDDIEHAGILISVGMYNKSNNQDGKWTSYYWGGAYKISYYKNGKLDGKSIEYDSDNRPHHVYLYQNGKKVFDLDLDDTDAE